MDFVTKHKWFAEMCPKSSEIDIYVQFHTSSALHSFLVLKLKLNVFELLQTANSNAVHQKFVRFFQSPFYFCGHEPTGSQPKNIQCTSLVPLSILIERLWRKTVWHIFNSIMCYQCHSLCFLDTLCRPLKKIRPKKSRLS